MLAAGKDLAAHFRLLAFCYPSLLTLGANNQLASRYPGLLTSFCTRPCLPLHAKHLTGLTDCRAHAANVYRLQVITGAETNKNFALGISNIPNADVLPAIGANVYDILKHRQLVLTRDAVALLHAHLLRSRLSGPNNLRQLPPS